MHIQILVVCSTYTYSHKTECKVTVLISMHCTCTAAITLDSAMFSIA